MSHFKRIVVFGATSGIAHECLRLWAADAREIILVGRDRTGLGRVADDLEARADLSTTCEVLDFADEAGVDALLNAIFAGPPVDLAVVSFGTLPDQQELQGSTAAAREALEVNGVLPVLLAEQLVNRMVEAGSGTLCVIGSVAGDRGRRSNYLYGAAKAMVATAVRGMQHRLGNGPVRAVLVKPGPTDTPMTAHLRGGKLKLAPVRSVAEGIVTGVERGESVIYVPGRWRVIMAVVRNVPDRIFNRMDI